MRTFQLCFYGKREEAGKGLLMALALSRDPALGLGRVLPSYVFNKNIF